LGRGGDPFLYRELAKTNFSLLPFRRNTGVPDLFSLRQVGVPLSWPINGLSFFSFLLFLSFIAALDYNGLLKSYRADRECVPWKDAALPPPPSLEEIERLMRFDISHPFLLWMIFQVLSRTNFPSSLYAGKVPRATILVALLFFSPSRMRSLAPAVAH